MIAGMMKSGDLACILWEQMLTDVKNTNQC